MEIKETLLIPEYDKAKSFYGKAKLKKYYKYSKRYNAHLLEKIELYSYNTLVLTIQSCKYNLNYDVQEKLLFSNTTLRHIKETLKQYYWMTSYKTGSKQDIIKNNGVEWYKR